MCCARCTHIPLPSILLPSSSHLDSVNAQHLPWISKNSFRRKILLRLTLLRKAHRLRRECHRMIMPHDHLPNRGRLLDCINPQPCRQCRKIYTSLQLPAPPAINNKLHRRRISRVLHINKVAITDNQSRRLPMASL